MTRDEIIGSHRWQWRERLVKWLVPRLSGDNAEKETSLEMVLEVVSAAYNEGIRDSADILQQLTEASQGERARALGIAADALTNLAARNDANRTPQKHIATGYQVRRITEHGRLPAQ